jgi:homoserine O-acetyltransferase
MQIAFNEAARQAVVRDPQWEGGDYEPECAPFHGLAVARMIGHLSYLSDAAFQRKFGRRLQDSDAYHFGPGHEFQVESYLSYQGEKFTKRFDPASLVTLSRAIDYYDRESLDGSKAEYLFTSFTSDWLYPTWQSAELLRLALTAGRRGWHEEIDVDMGHDAFLLDDVHQADLVRQFID